MVEGMNKGSILSFGLFFPFSFIHWQVWSRHISFHWLRSSDFRQLRNSRSPKRSKLICISFELRALWARLHTSETLMATLVENWDKCALVSNAEKLPTELRGSQRNAPRQSVPLESTIDTWIKDVCPYSGAYKTFIWPRSMAARVCVCVCVWDYQFSLRGEKPVKEIECHVVVNWVEGEAVWRDCVNAFFFQKPAQDETLLEEFYGLCEPLGKCPQTKASGCTCSL